MCTASSAIRTCGLRASASEYTATVAIPIAFAVRITRQAISPRLAMRILENISGAASRSDLIQRLAEVGDDVVDMLDTHRYAHDLWSSACPHQFLFRKLAVGG